MATNSSIFAKNIISMSEEKHYSGFVNIIGQPNVGKSTLMNALVGERLSIITNKPQTTRHRIFGILSGDDFQMVFSDTPGMIDAPAYKMQQAMNKFAYSTFEDADIMLFVTSLNEMYEDDHPLINRLKHVEAPKFLIINKMDSGSQEEIDFQMEWWKQKVDFTECIAVSALHKTNTEALMDKIRQYLPEGEAYYPKDQLTDRPERFFATEIIREKILENYHQEIPYSVEVSIESYVETQTNKGMPLAQIGVILYVSRKTQKSILIGKGGSALKKVGMEARIALEAFLDTKVFLEMHVKVRENWRDNEQALRGFGYD